MTSRPIRHAVRPGAHLVLVFAMLAACDQGTPSSLPLPSATASAPSPAGSAAPSSHPSAAPSPSDSIVPSPEPAPLGSSAAASAEGPRTAPPEPANAVPIRLVESGFTAFASDGNDFASFAAVLENPNVRWAAMRMRLTVEFLDDDGAFLAGHETFVQILPGQRTAIAGEVFGAGGARRMSVLVPDDTTAFEAYAGAGQRFVVAGVETSREGDLNVTRGRVTSRFETMQSSVQLSAVYRNSAGRIVGGAVGGLESIEPGARQPFEIIDSAPYRSLAETEVYWQISGLRQ